MTDNIESLPPEESDSIDRKPTEAPGEPSQLQEERIALELPVDVIAAITQRLGQAGQTQTEVILEALRLALAVDPTTSAVAKPIDRSLGQTNFSVTETPSPDLLQELQALRRRLTHLEEQLIPKVEALEGKLLAF